MPKYAYFLLLREKLMLRSVTIFVKMALLS
jgi:hypothetical protein